MSNTYDFVQQVRRAMDSDESDECAVHQAVELAYDRCVVGHGTTKGEFLSDLVKLDPEVFTITVNHLFTPINWSTRKLRTLWGIKNMATGNLLTLERDTENDVFKLKESSEDSDALDFAPMFTGSEDDARLFIKMLQDVPSDAPLGSNETLVSLSVQERVNVANLEAVEVSVIF